MVRDQGQEWDLVDQERRSNNGTEDATLGSTIGHLDTPTGVAGFPGKAVDRMC